MKRIAIIGAGFRGIGCLRVLLQHGYQVDVYEKNNDVGGVWHPSNNYQGLKIHTPAKLNQFFDFPYPDNIDLSERLGSKQIFEYIKSFCIAKDLYSHITFNTQVHKIQYNTQSKTSTLLLSTNNGREYVTNKYDFIINTNGFCDKHIPEFKGAEKFNGEIIHSFDATEEEIKSIISSNKKVTVVGAGKTSTDLVSTFSKYNYKLTWLYRKAYWFLRFSPLQNAIKNGSSGDSGFSIYKMLMLLGFLISSHFPNLGCWLWKMTDVIDTYGERHSDFKKFHVALIDDSEFKTLKESNKLYGVIGEIDRFDKNGYYLKNKRFIESDVVICCTGSSGTKSLVNIEIDGEKLNLNNVYKSYRASVIPQVPNLIFTAYHHFVMGLGDGELQAQWIMNYMESNYNEAYLRKNALTYDYPFFTKLILFDASEYYFPSFMKMQFDFIKNHEMGSMEYVKFIYNFFFKPGRLEPLKMNFSTHVQEHEIRTAPIEHA